MASVPLGEGRGPGFCRICLRGRAQKRSSSKSHSPDGRTLSPATPGYRDSFAQEAKVIAEQLQGHGGADVSTIEAELPPSDLTSSASFLDPTPSAQGQGQGQGQESVSPLSPPPPDSEEPSLLSPSALDLLFLKGPSALEEAASPADLGRWQLNVTMELPSPAPDALQAGEPSALAPKSPPTPQVSTELNKTCLLRSGAPPQEAAQPECGPALEERAGRDLSDVPGNKTFSFSPAAAFVTSTPHSGGAASGGLKLLQGVSGFNFPESPAAQEAPRMAQAEQPSARRSQGPLASAGNLPKALPKSGPLGKVVQEKRSLGGASLAVSRRGYQGHPFPGQKRWSAIPYKASGLPVLLKGRNSEAGRMKEAEPPAKAGNSPPPAAKVSQLLHSKSVPPRLSLHQRGSSLRDPKSRDPQAARSSRSLVPTQGARSRVPSKTVLDVQPHQQDRKLQPSPGPSCPQCLVLQKQVEDLKSQLAALQCLSGELQGLQGLVQDPSTANAGDTT
ncbi:uncharacterized protein CXorf49-like [Gracilinanus agilis]|uniref:uncharacterized protein CXorf49-like n=1 Tax=Gracilinanus agilis TaxID=191870 RepID=UPI001CFE7F38|nr:uncharacterized protein CXorf49-like [Gracilinanus agilis]